MDIDKILEQLQQELLRTLQDMGNAKSMEDRQTYSEIVSNLTDSIGTILESVAAYDDLDDEFYGDFEEEEE